MTYHSGNFIESLEEEAEILQRPWQRPRTLVHLRLLESGPSGFLYEGLEIEFDLHSETPGFVEIGGIRLAVTLLPKDDQRVLLVSRWNIGERLVKVHLEPWRIPGMFSQFWRTLAVDPGGLALVDGAGQEVPVSTPDGELSLVRCVLGHSVGLLVERAGTDATPTLAAIAAELRTRKGSTLVVCESLSRVERLGRELVGQIGQAELAQKSVVLIVAPWVDDELARIVLADELMARDRELANLVAFSQHEIDMLLNGVGRGPKVGSWAATTRHIESAVRRRELLLRDQVDGSQVVVTTIPGLMSSSALAGKRFDAVIVTGAGGIGAPYTLCALALARKQVVISGDPFAGPPLTRVKSRTGRQTLGQNVFYQPPLKELWDRDKPAVNVFHAPGLSFLPDKVWRILGSGIYPRQRSVSENPGEVSLGLSTREPEPGRPLVVVNTSHLKFRACADKNTLALLRALSAVCRPPRGELQPQLTGGRRPVVVALSGAAKSAPALSASVACRSSDSGGHSRCI